MKNDLVIRPGDFVEVVDPRAVRRVGYPKCVDDYLEEANKKYGNQLRQDLRNPRITEKCLREIAYGLAKRDHFGGPQRSVHLMEPLPEEFAGKVFSVYNVSVAQTGEYYPPSGWGTDWYEPGGLINRRSVRLVTISHFFSFSKDKTVFPFSKDKTVFLANHLKKVDGRGQIGIVTFDSGVDRK